MSAFAARRIRLTQGVRGLPDCLARAEHFVLRRAFVGARAAARAGGDFGNVQHRAGSVRLCLLAGSRLPARHGGVARLYKHRGAGLMTYSSARIRRLSFVPGRARPPHSRGRARPHVTASLFALNAWPGGSSRVPLRGQRGPPLRAEPVLGRNKRENLNRKEETVALTLRSGRREPIDIDRWGGTGAHL